MALRWVATAALEAARGFRRLKGHKQMPRFVTALRERDVKIESDKISRSG